MKTVLGGGGGCFWVYLFYKIELNSSSKKSMQKSAKLYHALGVKIVKISVLNNALSVKIVSGDTDSTIMVGGGGAGAHVLDLRKGFSGLWNYE